MTAALRSRFLIIATRILLLCIVVGLAWVAIDYGLRLRRWVWDQTDTVHFYPDMSNGMHWGSQGNWPAERPRGFLNVYDLVAATADVRDDATLNYGLDYAPLRLLVMTRWEKWTTEKYPALADTALTSKSWFGITPWHPPYSFYAPLLRFNDCAEIAAAIGLFLLARHWVIRGDRRWGSACRAGNLGSIYRPFRGCGAGLMAAILFWFNPAVIISTHGWPTWDEWIIPFFVFTLWLCCIDWWFTAGLVLGVGAMFKGQQLFIAPLFVLWPIFVGRPIAALRWLAGLALSVALLASPWLLSYVPGGVNENSVAADRKTDWLAICFVGVVFLFTLLPIGWRLWKHFRHTDEPAIEKPEPGRARRFVAILLPWLTPFYFPAAALLVALALFLCVPFFHGSLNWLYIGWGYGTRHYMDMVMGVSDNLAGLLSHRFNWRKPWYEVGTIDPYPIRLWPTHAVIFAGPTLITIRTLLIAIYLVAALVCIIGAAIQYRRNDPRFLVATTGAWLMFFTFMPQIHERYLIYAAGVGCCLTAVSFGFVLLDLFLTCLTFLMTMNVMLDVARDDGLISSFATQISPTFGDSLLKFIDHTFPDAGWAVLLCAAVFMYAALAPSRQTAWWLRFNRESPLGGGAVGALSSAVPEQCPSGATAKPEIESPVV